MNLKRLMGLATLFCLAAILPLACGKGAVKSETKDVGYTTLSTGENPTSGAPHGHIKKTTPPLTLEDIWNQLKPANLAWNVPDNMQLGEPQNASLVLTGKLALGDLEKRLKRKKFGGDLAGATKVEISTDLTAKMTGDGFSVVQVGPARQATTGDTTQWKWTLTPNQEGDQQKIHVDLMASVMVDGVEKSAPVTSLDKTVEVTSTLGQKLGKLFSSPWLWIFLVLLIVLGYYGLSSQNKKKA